DVRGQRHNAEQKELGSRSVIRTLPEYQKPHRKEPNLQEEPKDGGNQFSRRQPVHLAPAGENRIGPALLRCELYANIIRSLWSPDIRWLFVGVRFVAVLLFSLVQTVDLQRRLRAQRIQSLQKVSPCCGFA